MNGIASPEIDGKAVFFRHITFILRPLSPGDYWRIVEELIDNEVNFLLPGWVWPD